MKNKVKQLFAIILLLMYSNLIAKENIPGPWVNTVVQNNIAAACTPSTSETDLDVTTVRATILGGGDIWWDLNDAQYEIPKGSYKIFLIAGALWICGVYDGGTLMGAAHSYRQVN